MIITRGKEATAVGHSFDSILCTCARDVGYYVDEYVPDPNCPNIRDSVEDGDEDEDELEEVESEEDDNKEQRDETVVGRFFFTCSEDTLFAREVGSSTDCLLSVHDSSSKIEALAAED